MKKLIYLLPLALLSCGSGEDASEVSQEDVCKCSKLYDEASAYQEELENGGMVTGEAMDKRKEKYGKDIENCEENIHKKVGDEKFYEMSQKCK